MPVLSRAALLAVAAWLAAWFVVCMPGIARGDDRPRFEALLADGTRIEGDNLTGWLTADGKPQLSGHGLLSDDNPFLWLRDRSNNPPAPPAAFVETWTGDVLPGEVVGFRESERQTLEPLPEHFLIRPSESMRLSNTSDDVLIRVVARFVRRIVFQRRSTGTYQPNTVFYRDGRSAKFRGVRFSGEGVNLLLDNGPARAEFRELAEIHLAAADVWEAILDELAVLSPNAKSRLLEIETTAGLTVTASLARMTATVEGNRSDVSRWVHGVQPAWSLDVLSIYNGDIWIRHTYAPHELPLDRLFPSNTEQQSILGGAGFTPVAGRNVRGGALRSGGQEYGGGLGVHALCRLHFPLPDCAKGFRARVGIDAAAGDGGCVRARVYLGHDGKTDGPAIFESDFLLGGCEAVDTGKLKLADGSPKQRELILEIDPAHDGRPEGADPLDIRDMADWLDPVLLLDEEKVSAEIAARAARQVEAWNGWTVQVDDPASLEWVSFLDKSSGPAEFRTGTVAIDRPLVLRRKLRFGPRDNWLVVLASRSTGGNPLPQIEVRLDGEPIGQYEVPLRDRGQLFPAPIFVSLAAFRQTVAPDREVELEIAQTPGERSVPIVWSGIRITENLPTLFELLEDGGKFAAIDPRAGGEAKLVRDDAHSGSVSLKITPAGRFRHTLNEKVQIRRNPEWGQYRYLRFAFRKFGQGRVAVEIEHDGSVDRPLRYDAGQGEPCFGEATRVWVQRLPAEWIVITRDLAQEFGEFDATGLVLSAPDGEYALFDQVYLGRTPNDLDSIPAVETADDANKRAHREVHRPLLDAIRPAVVTIDFGDGRSGLGAIVSREGDVLTAGHLVIGPDRDARVRLADGRTVSAVTRGVSREQDLGMLRIKDEGVWPFLPLAADSNLPRNEPYVAAMRVSPTAPDDRAAKKGGKDDTNDKENQTEKDEKGEKETISARLDFDVVHILSVYRGAIWCSFESELPSTGGPLVDHFGRLLGIQFRASHGSSLGGFLYTRVSEREPALRRLRGGETWGDWPPGTGPMPGFDGSPVREGLKLTAVDAGSSAEAEGLAVGDVIRRAEGHSIVSLADLDKLLEDNNPGDEIVLEVLRDGKTSEKRIKLAPRYP